MDGAARPSYLRAMLRKLMIALLTLCLAAPAVALPACHGMPMQATQSVKAAPMTHDGDHHMPAKSPEEGPLDQLRLAHGCLGCATPMTSAEEPAPIILEQLVPWHTPIAHLSARNQRPDTPPPRA